MIGLAIGWKTGKKHKENVWKLPVSPPIGEKPGHPHWLLEFFY